MREIEKTFSDLAARGEGGLIVYITAGFPELEDTLIIADMLIQGGADIVELGIPFSDPIADGPTIQSAAAKALQAGTTPRKVLEIAEKIRQRNKTPLVILTYYNPIYRMGIKNFFETAKASGISGVIVPDLPIEEAGEYRKIAVKNEVDTIFLAAPSTPLERLKRIVENTSGFLYLVSIYGVTGAREKVQEQTIKLIEKTLTITRGKIPLAVGFGISTPEHVRTVIQRGADAAIVGSQIVKIIEDKHNHNDEEEMLRALREYTNQLKKATKKKSP
ncbi:MAG: tryptophan synthase subunit alpha [Candidatus Freyarchaeota archaeon]|nr:tryptophan synthase subunit alpha [Candidatus Jordarchaeia archaeon]MBS7267596.1 tryptophan synthase subunit alpha [Candidatus Jordarchaeia archaeon]MBS7278803.1 tryptophan synthase subunit alpha [Candidatus Jordarchaeia archaeon]